MTDETRNDLPGNPYFGESANDSEGRVHDALLAIAFELRTANMIAADEAQGGSHWAAISDRLGF